MNTEQEQGDWEAAAVRAEGFFLRHTPPGGLLTLIFHRLARHGGTAVGRVPLAAVRYELLDEATLHAVLNEYCPAVASAPDSANAPIHAGGDRVRFAKEPTAPVTVRMRQAWVLANAHGRSEFPVFVPALGAALRYEDSLSDDAFFPRAVSVLRGVIDKPLLEGCGGIPSQRRVSVIRGEHDGRRGTTFHPVWNVDHQSRTVTTPAAYHVSFERFEGAADLAPSELQPLDPGPVF